MAMDELDRAITRLVRKSGRRPVVELLDEEMVPIFAAMSGAERLALAFDMADSARAMMVTHLRSQHPAWNEDDIGREVARRLSHGADAAAFETQFAAPEDAILMKLVYYREGGSDRHLRDIAAMLQIAGDKVDRAYVASWAEQLGVAAEWQVVLDALAARGGS